MGTSKKSFFMDFGSYKNFCNFCNIFITKIIKILEIKKRQVKFWESYIF